MINTNMQEIIEWVKTQKRVTNGYLRKKFEINEVESDRIYAELKEKGYIGQMGYVICERR